MYEVVEAADEWIVRHRGLEVGRFPAQSAALQAVSERMRQETAPTGPVSFAMRFRSRS
jgi:hypothetical protein